MISEPLLICVRFFHLSRRVVELISIGPPGTLARRMRSDYIWLLVPYYRRIKCNSKYAFKGILLYWFDWRVESDISDFDRVMICELLIMFDTGRLKYRFQICLSAVFA